MATEKELMVSRMSLPVERVLEVHFDKFPQPPPEMMKLPGIAYWWHQMELTRERDISSIQRLVSNISSLTNRE